MAKSCNQKLKILYLLELIGYVRSVELEKTSSKKSKTGCFIFRAKAGR